MVSRGRREAKINKHNLCAHQREEGRFHNKEFLFHCGIQHHEQSLSTSNKTFPSCYGRGANLIQKGMSCSWWYGIYKYKYNHGRSPLMMGVWFGLPISAVRCSRYNIYVIKLLVNDLQQVVFHEHWFPLNKSDGQHMYMYIT